MEPAGPAGGVLPEPEPRLPEQPERARELVQLYYAIDSRRADNGPLVLQFVAATAGEGTSTVARGFAAVACAERSQPVLYVDCDSGRTSMPGDPESSLIAAFKAGQPIKGATVPVPDIANLSRAVLSPNPHPVLSLEAGEFRRLIDAVRNDFAITVLDTPAAMTTPDSVALSRFCDGTILVVRAETVKATLVESAKREIERAGGQLIGAVLNRRRMYIPDWLYQRL